MRGSSYPPGWTVTRLLPGYVAVRYHAISRSDMPPMGGVRREIFGGVRPVFFDTEREAADQAEALNKAAA